jgi:beta-glucosidase
VPAIVDAWFFGEQGGYALADILLGKVSPSGKLPVTFPRTREEASDYPNYPGENHRVEYREGLLVGYRFFDQKQIEPEYPFGFGLSYTDFKIEPATVRVAQAERDRARVEISIPVRNIGAMTGAEVVQVYVRPVNPVVVRPPKELKGFQKISLAPGERQTVLLSLDSKAFAHFDETAMRWVVPPGTFEILVGNSSRALRSAGIVTLQ